jgi:hypothetical protein
VLWLTDTVVPLTVFQDLNLGVKLLRKGMLVPRPDFG